MSDVLRVTARRQNGTAMDDNAAAAALTAFRNALPPGSSVTAWGLTDGAFEASADVAEGTTEAQFRAFAAGLMPAGIVGGLTLADDRGNVLFTAQVAASTVNGETHPTPDPKPTEWTEARR